jgi:hypothetical protein
MVEQTSVPAVRRCQASVVQTALTVNVARDQVAVSGIVRAVALHAPADREHPDRRIVNSRIGSS